MAVSSAITPWPTSTTAPPAVGSNLAGRMSWGGCQVQATSLTVSGAPSGLSASAVVWSTPSNSGGSGRDRACPHVHATVASSTVTSAPTASLPVRAGPVGRWLCPAAATTTAPSTTATDPAQPET